MNLIGTWTGSLVAYKTRSMKTGSHFYLGIGGIGMFVGTHVRKRLRSFLFLQTCISLFTINQQCVSVLVLDSINILWKIKIN